MSSAMTKEMEMYREMNERAEKGSIVMFGDDLFQKIPFAELAESSGLPDTILNRSVSEITVAQAAGAAEQVIVGLSPKKVFLHFGTEASASAETEPENFIESYRWLLYTLHLHTDAKLYIVSVCSEVPLAGELNRRLKKLSSECGCTFVELPAAASANRKIFEYLRMYIRSNPISFLEAMRG